jgi:hypothetical protein
MVSSSSLDHLRLCNNYINQGTTSPYKVCSSACFVCTPPPPQ